MVNEFQTPRGPQAIPHFVGPDRDKRILNHESFQRGLRGFHRDL
jgi:hypothetical protein